MSDQLEDASAQGRIRLENTGKILQAAEKVFAEHGFRGATTAAIAAEASLPKANIHYYFGTKAKLYRAVLDDILALWLSSFGDIGEGDDPGEILTHYIRAKMRLSKERPHASKVFANELIRGAPRIKGYLSTDLRDWVEEKAAIFDGWAAEGKIAPVDGHRLLFHIWAMTQTWADFAAQWTAVLGREDGLTDADFDAATAAVITTVLRTCGLESPR